MFEHFTTDRRGNFALTAAIVMVPLMAAVAGAFDYSTMLSKTTRVQDSLDAAGLAIAREFKALGSEEKLHTLGQQVFETNLNWPAQDSPSFSYVGREEDDGRIIVEVRSSFSHVGFIGWDFWKADRLSVVSLAPIQPACMLALDPSAGAAIRMGGSTELKLENCVMAANSSASNAISRSGAATLEAECVVTVGSTSGLKTRTRLGCDGPMHDRRATPDPLAKVDPPSLGPCEKLPDTDPKVLQPGTYCHQSWTGNISLAPGNYILRGGQIDLAGGGSIKGNGVTIFLRDGAQMKVTANQVAQLSAPESGPYAGILIFQDRNNSHDLVLTGGSGSFLTGFVYAPAARVLFRGNSTMSGEDRCIRIIASTINLSGNSSLSLNCDQQLGSRRIPTGEQSAILVR